MLIPDIGSLWIRPLVGIVTVTGMHIDTMNHVHILYRYDNHPSWGHINARSEIAIFHKNFVPYEEPHSEDVADW